MKDTKFRIWDIDAQTMHEVGILLIGHGATGYSYPAPGEEATVGTADTNRVLMQFTGLKDKNGKEIYEGDLVKCGEFEDDSDAKTYEVIYNEDGTYPAFDLKGWRGETNGICLFLNDGYLEVIGNIYESPELLKAPAATEQPSQAS